MATGRITPPTLYENLSEITHPSRFPMTKFVGAASWLERSPARTNLASRRFWRPRNWWFLSWLGSRWAWPWPGKEWNRRVSSKIHPAFSGFVNYTIVYFLVYIRGCLFFYDEYVINKVAKRVLRTDCLMERILEWTCWKRCSQRCLEGVIYPDGVWSSPGVTCWRSLGCGKCASSWRVLTDPLELFLSPSCRRDLGGRYASE